MIPEPLRSSPLRSADGLFHCAPDHAVEVAYMLSCAEAHTFRKPMDGTEVLELIREYLRGDMDAAEIRSRLAEWRQEDEADEKAETPNQEETI